MANDISIGIDVDGAADAKRDLDDVGDAATGLGDSFGDMGGRVRRFAADNAVEIGAMAIGIGAALLVTSNTLEVMAAQAEAAFGTSGETVSDWADDVNESMGTSSQRVEGMAAQFGLLVAPLGAADDVAAEFAIHATELASALDLFTNNTDSVAEAADILAEAFRGDFDALKEFNITLTEADVQQRLVEKGQQDLSGEARTLAERTAALELITEQAGDAFAYAASEQGQAELAARELKSVWVQLYDDLAEDLGPAIQALGLGLLVAYNAVADFLGGAWAEWTEDLSDVAEDIGWIVEKVEALVDAIRNIPSSIPNPFSGFDITPGFDVSDINRFFTGFAAGGTVAGTRGGQMVQVGEAGEDEVIMPASQYHGLNPGGGAGAASYVINVDVSVGADPAAVGAQIVDAIEAHERRAGSGWRAAA